MSILYQKKHVLGGLHSKVHAGGGGSYQDTVDGLSGGAPLAHWRLSEVSGLQVTDRTAGARHGTYSGTIGYGAQGLPQDSDSAVDFAGVGSASVAHDAGLALPSFSLSFWFRLHTLPSVEALIVYPIVAKDQVGLHNGDFAIWVDEDGTLGIQFQSDAAAYPLSEVVISPNTTYHLVVRADNTGFDAYLNGLYLGKNTGFTGAWASNSNALSFATVPWSTGVADAIIDEVALFARVLSLDEVLELGQRSGILPVAVDDVAVVPESQTTVLDVVRNDSFTGDKLSLDVEILSQAVHGTASVRANKDVDFVADAVAADTPDSFTYRITDVGGSSNAATVGLTVQNSGSSGGGTLVYDWYMTEEEAQTYIDGVPIGERNDDVICPFEGADNHQIPPTNYWGLFAKTGASLFKGVQKGGNNTVCLNRAPTGQGCIELHVPVGVHGVMLMSLQLFNKFDTSGPRHLRCVMEVKTCRSGDLTTYKANGLGTKTGPYPDFINSTNGTGKYFAGLFGGSGPSGACATNWWNNPTYTRNRMGLRNTWSSGTVKVFRNYSYAYGRPTQCGWKADPIGLGMGSPGMSGYWHRVEYESQLTNPALANSTWSGTTTVQPTGGDGYDKVFATADIDGVLGSPGARTLCAHYSNIVHWSTENNRHLNGNLVGPWIDLNFGGGDISNTSQIECWAWIRRIQIYRY